MVLIGDTMSAVKDTCSAEPSRHILATFDPGKYIFTLSRECGVLGKRNVGEIRASLGVKAG